MKKTIVIMFLSFATLFMFSNAAFANSCNYEAKVKSLIGSKVTITSIAYKYVDDPFAVWWGFATQEPDLNNSSDVYTESVNNITLTCDSQKYAFSVTYTCIEANGVTWEYDKETGKIDGGHWNTAYIIISECGGGLIYAEDAWPLMADADVSLVRQQLPVPGGGVSDCLWNTQTGTILSNSQANVDWQSDGNLVVYVNGSPIWASGTVNNGDRLCFQGDGNLVVYKNGLPTWSTGTVNTGQTLHLQVDCNLVIHDGGNNYKWGSGATCGG